MPISVGFTLKVELQKLSLFVLAECMMDFVHKQSIVSTTHRMQPGFEEASLRRLFSGLKRQGAQLLHPFSNEDSTLFQSPQSF
jgi:hypothetical protein